MTINEMIRQLEELKRICGGTTPVYINDNQFGKFKFFQSKDSRGEDEIYINQVDEDGNSLDLVEA